jgi:hypothetical protein
MTRYLLLEPKWLRQSATFDSILIDLIASPGIERSVLPERSVPGRKNGWFYQNGGGRTVGFTRTVGSRTVERMVHPRMITVEQSVPKQSASRTEWWRQNCRSHDSTQANPSEDNPGSVCRKPTSCGTIGSRENIGGATAAVAEELMGKTT